MWPRAWANYTTADLFYYPAAFIQPLFIVSVLIPSLLFDPVFNLPFRALHIYFSTLLAVHCVLLYYTRRSGYFQTILTMVTVTTMAIWLLLAGVDFSNNLHLSTWTSIYIQCVILHSILFYSLKFKV